MLGQVMWLSVRRSNSCDTSGSILHRQFVGTMSAICSYRYIRIRDKYSLLSGTIYRSRTKNAFVPATGVWKINKSWAFRNLCALGVIYWTRNEMTVRVLTDTYLCILRTLFFGVLCNFDPIFELCWSWYVLECCIPFVWQLFIRCGVSRRCLAALEEDETSTRRACYVQVPVDDWGAILDWVWRVEGCVRVIRCCFIAFRVRERWGRRMVWWGSEVITRRIAFIVVFYAIFKRKLAIELFIICIDTL